MPRNKDYNKKEKLREIRKKRFFQGLSRDFNIEILKDISNLIDEDSDLVELNVDPERITKELYNTMSGAMDSSDFVRLGMLSMLLWDVLETNVKNG